MIILRYFTLFNFTVHHIHMAYIEIQLQQNTYVQHLNSSLCKHEV